MFATNLHCFLIIGDMEQVWIIQTWITEGWISGSMVLNVNMIFCLFVSWVVKYDHIIFKYHSDSGYVNIITTLLFQAKDKLDEILKLAALQ